MRSLLHWRNIDFLIMFTFLAGAEIFIGHMSYVARKPLG